MIVVHFTDNKGVRKSWTIGNDTQNIVLNTINENIVFKNISDCLWLVPGTIDFDA